MHGHVRTLEMKHRTAWRSQGKALLSRAWKKSKKASDQGAKDIQLVRTAFRKLQK